MKRKARTPLKPKTVVHKAAKRPPHKLRVHLTEAGELATPLECVIKATSRNGVVTPEPTKPGTLPLSDGETIYVNAFVHSSPLKASGEVLAQITCQLTGKYPFRARRNTRPDPYVIFPVTVNMDLRTRTNSIFTCRLRFDKIAGAETEKNGVPDATSTVAVHENDLQVNLDGETNEELQDCHLIMNVNNRPGNRGGAMSVTTYDDKYWELICSFLVFVPADFV